MAEGKESWQKRGAAPESCSSEKAYVTFTPISLADTGKLMVRNDIIQAAYKSSHREKQRLLEY
jgi:hypothetical protein